MVKGNGLYFIFNTLIKAIFSSIYSIWPKKKKGKSTCSMIPIIIIIYITMHPVIINNITLHELTHALHHVENYDLLTIGTMLLIKRSYPSLTQIKFKN